MRNLMRRRADSAESYRSLHATVKFAAGEQPVRCVLVVDVDRERPSAVAERLSETFARGGDPTVFVDANVRSTANTTPGFLDLVAGKAQTAEVLTAGSVDGLRVVGPGSFADPDLLASDGVATALAALLTTHEYLIVRCAGLPQHGDAIALAPRVDAVILTVTGGVTRRPRAIDARDALERVGGRLLGVVMVEPARRRWW